MRGRVAILVLCALTAPLLTAAANAQEGGPYELGLVSYERNGDLSLAHCSNVACTGATLTTLDTVGQYTSVTIGADGLPLISYFGSDEDDLKVAHCTNPFCVPYFRRR